MLEFGINYISFRKIQVYGKFQEIRFSITHGLVYAKNFMAWALGQVMTIGNFKIPEGALFPKKNRHLITN